MLLNDDDRDGQQAGKIAGPENPANKEPGEFTRLFLADQSATVSPTPEIGAETPGTSPTPGELKSRFATQNRHDLAATKGGMDELVVNQPAIEQPSTMPSFSATGEFTKVGETSFIAESSSSQQKKSLTDEFPRQELSQEDSAPAPGVGKTMEPRPVSQEILEEAFRHPLTPRPAEPLNLQPNNAPLQADPKPRGFTQLFSAAPAPAPTPASLNTANVPQVEVRGAPSDFTRVVRSSEVRQALEKPASQPPQAPPNPQGIPPVAPQFQPPVLQYQPPQIPQPQYAPPQMPGQPAMQYPVPIPQMYSPQMPQPPQVPGLQMPGLQPPPVPQAPEPSPGSKWVAYLPILIVINVLFMVAVLLILFFALRH